MQSCLWYRKCILSIIWVGWSTQVSKDRWASSADKLDFQESTLTMFHGWGPILCIMSHPFFYNLSFIQHWVSSSSKLYSTLHVFTCNFCISIYMECGECFRSVEHPAAFSLWLIGIVGHFHCGVFCSLPSHLLFWRSYMLLFLNNVPKII